MALSLETHVEEDSLDDWSTNNNVTYTVTLGKNEIDSAYGGVDCYPASMSIDLPTMAFLYSFVRFKWFFKHYLTLHALHIIKDCRLFWTYRLDQSLEVSTASSGIL